MFRPPSNSDALPPTPAIVRLVSWQDAQWNRRVFKAPPLEVEPPVPELSDFSPELRPPEPLR